MSYMPVLGFRATTLLLAEHVRNAVEQSGLEAELVPCDSKCSLRNWLEANAERIQEGKYFDPN